MALGRSSHDAPAFPPPYISAVRHSLSFLSSAKNKHSLSSQMSLPGDVCCGSAATAVHRAPVVRAISGRNSSALAWMRMELAWKVSRM